MVYLLVLAVPATATFGLGEQPLAPESSMDNISLSKHPEKTAP